MSFSASLPCQVFRATISLSISFITTNFFRLQSGPISSSARPSPVSRAITTSSGSSSSWETTRLILREEGKELWSNPFEDVKETDTFYNALSYCHRNGLLKGTGETQFSPDEETNRAMIVTTLYRIAGSPAVSGTNPFTDVPTEQWYTDAVIWASP